MGEMADYDLYENVNKVGRVESRIYKCSYCGLKFGSNKSKCQEHVNSCEKTNKR